MDKEAVDCVEARYVLSSKRQRRSHWRSNRVLTCVGVEAKNGADAVCDGEVDSDIVIV